MAGNAIIWSTLIMKKTFLTAILISTAALGLAACESWPTSKPPGTYKTTSQSTNAQGTKTTTDQTTYVYRDGSGNKKATVKTETSSDPKGLFNKQKTETVKSYN